MGEPVSERSKLHLLQENVKRRSPRLILRALSVLREKQLDPMVFHLLILLSHIQPLAESTLSVNSLPHQKSLAALMVLSLTISTTNVSTQKMDLMIVNVGTPVPRTHNVPTVATRIVLVLEHTAPLPATARARQKGGRLPAWHANPLRPRSGAL